MEGQHHCLFLGCYGDGWGIPRKALGERGESHAWEQGVMGGQRPGLSGVGAAGETRGVRSLEPWGLWDGGGASRGFGSLEAWVLWGGQAQGC